jgi:hypothetical protein
MEKNLLFDRECFADVDYNETGQQILPLLGDIIKTFREDRKKWPSQDPITPLIDSSYDNLIWDVQDVAPTQDLLQMPTTSNIWTEIFAPGGDNTYNQQNHPSPTTTLPQSQNSPLLLPGGEQFIPNEELMGQPCQNIGTYKDGPAKNRRLPIDGESYTLAYNLNLSFDAIHPVPAISNRANRTSDYHPEQKIQQQYLAECYFLQDRWLNDPTCFSSIADIMNFDSWDKGEGGYYFNDISDPHILEARSKTSTRTDDTPSFDTAIRCLFQAQWWRAMYDKLVTIMVDFDCWDYVPRTPNMNVLPSTWAFKIK